MDANLRLDADVDRATGPEAPTNLVPIDLVSTVMMTPRPNRAFRSTVLWDREVGLHHRQTIRARGLRLWWGAG
jgi:hypothetical protein